MLNRGLHELAGKSPEDVRRFLHNWKNSVFALDNFDLAQALREKEAKVQAAMRMSVENVGENVREKEAVVEGVSESLKTAIAKFDRLKKENQELKERMDEVQTAEKQAKAKLEEDIASVQGKVMELEKAYVIEKTKYEEQRSELFGRVKAGEIETEATKRQMERLRNERKTLKDLHKEQKHTCMNFFSEAIQPLQTARASCNCGRPEAKSLGRRDCCRGR